jgi:hypothetical protein
MKKSFVWIMFLTVWMVCFSQTSKAQISQDSIKSHIETMDGNEFIGIILEQSPEKIRLKTEKLGEISILRSDIKTITRLPATTSKNGTYWLDNPQSTRYFWTPNAYSLKKGEGYYQNVWVFFNQAVYGFTDHFSGAIGTMPLFLFGGGATPAWFTLKYSVPVVKDKFNLGAGLLAGTVLGESNANFGIFYGISTFGTKDNNVNIGLGWAFAGGEIAKNPTVNISGMFRTGPKGYFITENYFIGTSDNFMVLMSLGGRSIIKHVGLDYGLFIPVGGEVNAFVAVPWLGLTIPFGNKTPARN